MTYSRVAEIVAVELGIPFDMAHRVLRLMLARITDSLVADGRCELRGFGRFTVRSDWKRRKPVQFRAGKLMLEEMYDGDRAASAPRALRSEWPGRESGGDGKGRPGD